MSDSWTSQAIVRGLLAPLERCLEVTIAGRALEPEPREQWSTADRPAARHRSVAETEGIAERDGPKPGQELATPPSVAPVDEASGVPVAADAQHLLAGPRLRLRRKLPAEEIPSRTSPAPKATPEATPEAAPDVARAKNPRVRLRRVPLATEAHARGGHDIARAMSAQTAPAATNSVMPAGDVSRARPAGPGQSTPPAPGRAEPAASHPSSRDDARTGSGPHAVRPARAAAPAFQPPVASSASLALAPFEPRVGDSPTPTARPMTTNAVSIATPGGDAARHEPGPGRTGPTPTARPMATNAVSIATLGGDPVPSREAPARTVSTVRSSTPRPSSSLDVTSGTPAVRGVGASPGTSSRASTLEAPQRPPQIATTPNDAAELERTLAAVLAAAARREGIEI